MCNVMLRAGVLARCWAAFGEIHLLPGSVLGKRRCRRPRQACIVRAAGSVRALGSGLSAAWRVLILSPFRISCSQRCARYIGVELCEYIELNFVAARNEASHQSCDIFCNAQLRRKDDIRFESEKLACSSQVSPPEHRYHPWTSECRSPSSPHTKLRQTCHPRTPCIERPQLTQSSSPNKGSCPPLETQRSVLQCRFGTDRACWPSDGEKARQRVSEVMEQRRVRCPQKRAGGSR